MASQDSSTPVSIHQWFCSKHPDIEFTVLIPEEYEFGSGEKLPFPSLVHTIYWECPRGPKKWEEESLKTDWSKTGDEQDTLKAFLEEYKISEGGCETTNELKQPCNVIDIYAGDANTYHPDTTFEHRITGHYTMPDMIPTPLKFYCEISEYGPPKPPDITNAYGDQGSIGPRTPRGFPDLGLSIRSDTFESVPSLDTATGTSESSYSLLSPTGSVMPNEPQIQEETPAGQGGQVSEVEDNE